MRILIFNIAHIGDIFFSQAIVKTLCDSNPEQEFMLCQLYNYHLFQNIPNLKIIDDMQDLMVQNHLRAKKYIRMADDLIAINTWIGGYHELVPVMECNPLAIFDIFARTIQEINHEFGLSLMFDTNRSHLEKLPSLPYDRFEPFDSWKDRLQKDCIFYYNYHPQSGQHIPVQSDHEHSLIIRTLSETFPDKMILVPKRPIQIQDDPWADNVISCEDVFGVHESLSCENVSQLAVIANSCEISVHYNIGACFYYLNKGSYQQNRNGVRIHINSVQCNFSDRLIRTMHEVEKQTGARCSIMVRPLVCNHVQDIIQKLPDLIRSILAS